MKNTEATQTKRTAKCIGCEWNGYKHNHRDSEDGPREQCCKHTCGR